MRVEYSASIVVDVEEHEDTLAGIEDEIQGAITIALQKRDPDVSVKYEGELK